MSAVDTALHGLRARIADGRFAPGSRLPSEGDLCVELGVARSSLREATRMLAALGVLETRHGSGTYVGDLRGGDVISALSLTMGLLPLESVLELYEMRRVLESHVASMAAARRTTDDVDALASILDEIESATDDDVHSMLDHRFHMRIATIAGNEAVAAMLGVMRSRSRAYRIFADPHARAIKAESQRGHRAILEAITRQDPVAAAQFAAAHVSQTEKWLREIRPAVLGSETEQRVQP